MTCIAGWLDTLVSDEREPDLRPRCWSCAGTECSGQCLGKYLTPPADELPDVQF